MKCFVIMPFGNPKSDPQTARKFELIYSQWIKPTVEAITIDDTPNAKISCHRADKELRPQEIITHLIENLVTADIVIADLSGRSPNVFYELGVRHAVNNKTILIAEDLDDIPFDLRGLRAIVYKYEPEHMLMLKSSLEQAIKEILNDPDKIDNPVRRFLYTREVDKLIKQPIPPGYDVVKSIISEMASLRNEFSNHTNEVRHIVRQITSTDVNNTFSKASQEIDLKFFEGIWRSKTSSTYCARVVNGELLMPYCYMGNSELTGHYHNFRLIGQTVFSRFRWFEDDRVSGFSFLKIVSDDELKGGWWHNEDISSEISGDISRINVSIPGMNKSTFRRVSKAQNFPSWAEQYFNEVQIRDGKVIYRNLTDEEK